MMTTSIKVNLNKWYRQTYNIQQYLSINLDKITSMQTDIQLLRLDQTDAHLITYYLVFIDMIIPIPKLD